MSEDTVEVEWPTDDGRMITVRIERMFTYNEDTDSWFAKIIDFDCEPSEH